MRDVDVGELRDRRVFFCNDTATTEIYTLSLHDALPISGKSYALSSSRTSSSTRSSSSGSSTMSTLFMNTTTYGTRSEEHTSELQSRQYLVCRLLLEKKKQPSELLPTRWHRRRDQTAHRA